MSFFISRNKDGWLGLYSEKPYRDNTLEIWTTKQSGCVGAINRKLFPDLKWSDNPLEVEIVPKNFSK